jgi:integrase
MASLIRRSYETKDSCTGKDVRKKTRKWYGKYLDERGVLQRVPLSLNKTVAQQMLNKLLEQVERKKAGLYHPAEEHARRALGQHLDEYLAEKRATGLPDEQVGQTASRVRTIIDGCRFAFPGDICVTAVLDFLSGLRQDRSRPELPQGDWFTPVQLANVLGVTRQAITQMVRRQGWQELATGRARARRFPRSVAEQILERRCRGLGSQTIAYYWREMVAFCRWMVSPRQKRLLENPLAGVSGPDPRDEPRHDRRALPLAELLRLLEVARLSAWTWRGLTRLDRYFLYLTACTTGFRRKELSALTPASFDLDSASPTASLPGRGTKNKRAATQPLPSDVAEALRGYLHGREAESPIWPRKALREIVAALRHDLAEARIPYVIDGPEGPLFADLHALRHSYVLLLDQAGVSVKQAMSLARHADPKLTMARYGRPQLGDLASALNRLPPLVGRPEKEEANVLRATGTAPSTGPALAPFLAPLAPKLAQPVDSQREELMVIDDSVPAGEVAVTPFPGRELRTDDGGRERLRVFDTAAQKGRTPGDRRRASSIGEELVPKRKAGRGLWRGTRGPRGPRHKGPTRRTGAVVRHRPASVTCGLRRTGQAAPLSVLRTQSPRRLARSLGDFSCRRRKRKSSTHARPLSRLL